MPQLGPLDPIFDVPITRGSIEVGNTPGIPWDYDHIVIDIITAIWYCIFGSTPPVDWPTYTEAIALNLYEDWGQIYTEAWTDEHTPMEWPTIEQAVTDDARLVLGEHWMDEYVLVVDLSVYDEVMIDHLFPLWFCLFATTDAVVWETLAAAIAADLATESPGKGTVYFAAWYDESGEPPADYDSTVTGLSGCVWYALCDQLV